MVKGAMAPVDLLYRCLRRGCWTEYLLYEGKEETRLALGERARLVLSGDGLSLFDGKHTTREACTDPLKQAERLLSSLPFPDWSAYGYIGFDVARSYGPYSRCIAEPVLALLVPETEVLLNAEGVTIRTTGEAEEVAHLLVEQAPSPVPVASALALDERDRDRYTGCIRELLPHLGLGHLQKAIIARSVTLADQCLDLPGTYSVGSRVNSWARSFCFSLGQVGGVGFPPETLLEADGRGLIQTNPLAGTRPRGASEAEDERLRRELFHVAKEVKEHALSVLAAQAEVASVCTPGSVHIEGFMDVKRFRFVQHLSSRVSGRLAEGRTTWDALGALFPGITVTGIEKSSALAWIDRLEEEARGPYAGAVGWIDSRGGADLAIALRSAFQYAGAIHMSAGAGIVAESDPDLEYGESQSKMRAMLHSLVVQTEGRV
jgi:salicylate synthetase